MDPHVNHGNGQKCVEAGGETFPADDHAAVLALELGKRPLGMEAWDANVDGAPTRLSGFPYPFGDLGPDPASAESMTQVFGIIPFVCRDDLGALISIRGRRARRQRHASPIGETVDEDALAFPAMCDALTATFAKGKRSHQPPRTATESSRDPRPVQAGALASRPRFHRPAGGAATDAPHSWTPIGARGGDHPSGSR